MRAHQKIAIEIDLNIGQSRGIHYAVDVIRCVLEDDVAALAAGIKSREYGWSIVETAIA